MEDLTALRIITGLIIVLNVNCLSFEVVYGVPSLPTDDSRSFSTCPPSALMLSCRCVHSQISNLTVREKLSSLPRLTLAPSTVPNLFLPFPSVCPPITIAHLCCSLASHAMQKEVLLTLRPKFGPSRFAHPLLPNFIIFPARTCMAQCSGWQDPAATSTTPVVARAACLLNSTSSPFLRGLVPDSLQRSSPLSSLQCALRSIGLQPNQETSSWHSAPPEPWSLVASATRRLRSALARATRGQSRMRSSSTGRAAHRSTSWDLAFILTATCLPGMT